MANKQKSARCRLLADFSRDGKHELFRSVANGRVMVGTWGLDDDQQSHRCQEIAARARRSASLRPRRAARRKRGAATACRIRDLPTQSPSASTALRLRFDARRPAPAAIEMSPLRSSGLKLSIHESARPQDARVPPSRTETDWDVDGRRGVKAGRAPSRAPSPDHCGPPPRFRQRPSSRTGAACGAEAAGGGRRAGSRRAAPGGRAPW